MRARFKSFLTGLIIGGLIAFFLGMNFGRGVPLLSNPFAERDLVGSVKGKAGEIARDARGRIHDATRPPAPPQ